MTGHESIENALLAEIDGIEQDGLVFCSKAYALFEGVRAEPDGVTRLRLLQGKLIDRLMGEVLPLCRYLQLSYQAGRYMAVKWINGDQPFDAIITQRGAWVDAHGQPRQFHVEITIAQHPNEYLVGQALEEHGAVFGVDGMRRVKVDGKKSVESVPMGRWGNSHVVDFSSYLSKAVASKTQKQPPYPDRSVLIVLCHLNSAYMPEEWEGLMEMVSPKISFGPFSEIYVYDNRTHMDRTFYAPRSTNEAV